MMRVTYNNYSGNITEQQAIRSREYLKIFTEDSAIKKIEKYIDNEVYCIAFYDINQESVSTILKIDYDNYNSSVEIIQREILPEHIIENVINYQKPNFNFIQSKYRVLLDKDNQIVCEQSYNLENDLIDLERTAKYSYYAEDYDPDYDLSKKKFIVYYNTDGSFHFAEHLWQSDYDREEYHAHDLDRFKREMELNEQEFQYYLTAEFLPQ